jgi:hypothetical protein
VQIWEWMKYNMLRQWLRAEYEFASFQLDAVEHAPSDTFDWKDLVRNVVRACVDLFAR